MLPIGTLPRLEVQIKIVDDPSLNHSNATSAAQALSLLHCVGRWDDMRARVMDSRTAGQYHKAPGLRFPSHPTLRAHFGAVPVQVQVIMS